MPKKTNVKGHARRSKARSVRTKGVDALISDVANLPDKGTDHMMGTTKNLLKSKYENKGLNTAAKMLGEAVTAEQMFDIIQFQKGEYEKTKKAVPRRRRAELESLFTDSLKAVGKLTAGKK